MCAHTNTNSEDDWKSLARSKLHGFEEELHIAHEAGLTSYSGLKAWTFINGVVYCLTVVTTIGRWRSSFKIKFYFSDVQLVLISIFKEKKSSFLSDMDFAWISIQLNAFRMINISFVLFWYSGYGHISPVTNTGRAITIIYAIIGIPIFLILLADFGKLFTRGIKFVWAFVRRLYYTGSMRRVRKQPQVQVIRLYRTVKDGGSHWPLLKLSFFLLESQQMMRNMSIAYDYATFRRPSQVAKEADLEQPQTATTLSAGAPTDTPTTPIPPEISVCSQLYYLSPLSVPPNCDLVSLLSILSLGTGRR